MMNLKFSEEFILYWM